MLQGPWVLGDRYSTSDAYLFTLARGLEGDGVDVQRFPKVADHMRRMESQPGVDKVLALHGS
jgi:glutathione S-transferase